MDPVAPNFPAGTPGEFTLVHQSNDAGAVQGRIAADGSVICTRPYPWYSEFFTKCTYRVEDDGSGHWRLFAADSFTLSSEGRAYLDGTNRRVKKSWAKVYDLRAVEWRMQGYAPVTSFCGWDESRRVYKNYNQQIDEVHDYSTCSPVMSVPDNSSHWALRSGTTVGGLAAGRQQVVLRSDSNFPPDVQVRAHLRHVLGTLRADAGCPLPGFEGGQAIEVAAAEGSVGTAVQRVVLDRNLLAGEEGDAELLVRYTGEETVGAVRLAMAAETATRRHELDALQANGMVLGEGAWLRLLRMPSGHATLLAPAADRMDSLPATRVSGVATASGQILLVGGGTEDFTLDAVETAGDRFTARLTLPQGMGVRAVAGRFEPGLFDGIVLPAGWSLSDYLGGRIASDAERLQFGRLTLAPDAAVPALPALAELARREVGSTPRSGYAVELDVAGNLAMIAPGCELAGAVTPSPSVGDHYEVALASAGSDCDATGDSVGVARMDAGGALEVWLRNGGQTHRMRIGLP